MTEVPPDAERSPDGHYWWDGSAWQAVPGGAADSGQAQDAAPADQSGSNQQNGELTIEIGPVTELTHTHDEVVAMLEQAGTPLPQGEAYA